MATPEPSGHGPERISVSREALRAELAELELRLIKYLDEQLHEKANKVEIVALATSVQDKANAREFGELRLSVATHDKALKELQEQLRIQEKVNEALREKAKETAEKSASNFTRGEKVIATLLTLIALGIQLYVVTGGFG
jgi:hypothetical protein